MSPGTNFVRYRESQHGDVRITTDTMPTAQPICLTDRHRGGGGKEAAIPTVFSDAPVIKAAAGKYQIASRWSHQMKRPPCAPAKMAGRWRPQTSSNHRIGQTRSQQSAGKQHDECLCGDRIARWDYYWAARA